MSKVKSMMCLFIVSCPLIYFLFHNPQVLWIEIICSRYKTNNVVIQYIFEKTNMVGVIIV